MATPLNHLAEATGYKLAIGGAGVSTGSGLWVWLGANHQVLASIGVIVGIIVGITGLIIQSLAARARERRERETHAAAMARLRAGHDA